MKAASPGPGWRRSLATLIDERPHRARAFLIAIVIAALTISGFWALRVPFLQGTDEQAHADYAYALFDAGDSFNLHGAVPADHVTKQIRFLQQTSNFWDLRFYHDARAPLGYDTRAYFSAIDDDAPAPSNRAPATGDRFPYVAFTYPVGFYLLASFVIREAYQIGHGSLSATYFAARGLGVAMLGIAVIFAYRTLRRLKYRPSTSLALATVIAILPLSSWVCGYIQPDTMVFALVSSALFFAIDFKQHPFGVRRLAPLSAALAATILVKQHYGVALTLACALSTLSSLLVRGAARRQITIAGVAVVLIPAVAFVISTSQTPIGHLGVTSDITRYQRIGSISQTFSTLLRTDLRGIFDLYAGGNAFKSFWFEFGDLLTPEISDRTLRVVCEALVALVSIAVFVMMVVRQCYVCVRLAAVTTKHRKIALSLLFGDVMLTVYFSWLGLLLAVLALSNGKIYLEGRYFLPVLLPTILLSVRALPRLFPRTLRDRYSKLFVAGWLAFAIAMSPAAATSMNARFYGTGGIRNDRTSDALIAVVAMRTDNVSVSGLRSISIVQGETLKLSVMVATQRPSSHVSGLECSLDGHPLVHAVSPSGAASFDGLRFRHYTVRFPAFPRPLRARVRLTAYVDGVSSGYEDATVFVSPYPKVARIDP